jgi:hypothetical protein
MVELSFNGKVQQGHEPYFEMGPTEGSVRTLIIKSVAFHHTGTYTCVEDNGQGDYHLIHLIVTKAEPMTSPTPTLHSVSRARTELTHTDTASLTGSTGASCPFDFKTPFIGVTVSLVLLGPTFIGLLVYVCVLCTRRKTKKVKKDFKKAIAEREPCLDEANRDKEQCSIELRVIENQANNNTSDIKSDSSQHAMPTTSEDHT